MKRLVILAAVFVLLIVAESAAQDTEKITFHVSSVHSEQADDEFCATGKCSAKKFTVEGYTDSAQYVLQCVEYIANEPSPHFTVVCPKLHVNNNYDAWLGSDFISFGNSKKPSENEPLLVVYSIVSEKEIAAKRH